MTDKYSTVNMFLKPVIHLMLADDVTEIMINKYDDIWVKRYGFQHEKTDINFKLDELKGLVTIIASASFKEIGNESSDNSIPKIMSAGIPGFRFEIWNTPISTFGPSMTIRKIVSKKITLETYFKEGQISESHLELIIKIITKKRNVFIAGSTGSGKTTFCNALIEKIPKTERLIVIENIQELNISIPNVVFLQSDEEQGCGINQLIKSALRGCPDRIIIGEVRGEEAESLLIAANTGHPGTIATLHANSSYEVLNRLEDMVMQSKTKLPIELIQKRIALMRPFLIFLKNEKVNDLVKPIVSEITEIINLSKGKYEAHCH
jgi:pilus assembly protein CpaF